MVREPKKAIAVETTMVLSARQALSIILGLAKLGEHTAGLRLAFEDFLVKEFPEDTIMGNLRPALCNLLRRKGFYLLSQLSSMTDKALIQKFGKENAEAIRKKVPYIS
jgi:hypothetical protein